ncbi:energy-coupling factor transporter ATPase [Bifidobacterium sp.]|jgi:energy-coupling factor transport system ATP-binding protein|uniref:energy-coupling factor transporter ATPase n=1 Tax=Bifidobacterium sp. TaxID=41200 RepID=UPI0025B80CBF|nr:energy-coupling factor transporter ATPase [Bifidobacterium sp.]MCI1635567.1 energy-coupling factor transporter ATPase [Bifidobacterium sp.]
MKRLSDSPACIVSLRDVDFSYDRGNTWALKDINIDVHAGERIFVVGSNGSGKSTLSRIIAAFVSPDDGLISYFGSEVYAFGTIDAEGYRQARHRIGMVFQNPEDQIVTTVTKDDVAFGPENLSVPRKEIIERVEQSLQHVSMTTSALRDPTKMSGGQQQRVAIAGALAMQPDLLVLDEPEAMLDSEGKEDVMQVLDVLSSRGTAIVHITHDFEDLSKADRVIALEEGRIIADCPPEKLPDALSKLNTATTHEDDNVETATPSSPVLPRTRPLAEASTRPSPSDHTIPSLGWQPSLPAADNVIDVRDVSFRFSDGDHDALTDVSFQAKQGEVIAIVGHNGSGKSTLSRILCALVKPSSGLVDVCGIRLSGNGTSAKRQSLRALRHKVGYVMQHPERQLFADTVRDDVAYGPKNLGYSKQEVQQRVDEAMQFLGIAVLADRSPFELSGGQQRLCAIAGVIACTPDVLVMDEPTANLDTEARTRMNDLIAKLSSRGVTVIMTTHSLNDALKLADRSLWLEEGQVKAFGPSKEVLGSYRHVMSEAATSRSSSDRQLAEGDQQQHSNNRAFCERSDAQIQSSLLSKMDPRAKMLGCLAMMLTAFFITTPYQLALGAAMTLVITAASRIPPLRILHSVRVFLAMFVIMGLLNLFVVHTGTVLIQWGPLLLSTGGIWSAVLYTCRFALVIILGAVVMQTTTPTQMTDAFESLLKPLQIFGIHTHEVSLVMSLALRFIPILTKETSSVIDAQSARGGSVESGGVLQRIRAITAIIVPVFAGTLRHADNLGLALDARCYEGGNNRTHLRVLRFSHRDTIFGVLVLVYILTLLLIP